MLIPYQNLDPDTLNSLIEHYVLREGTDYGDSEVSLSDKCAQVLQQIKAGSVVILYSQLHETVTLLAKHEMQQHMQD